MAHRIALACSLVVGILGAARADDARNARLAAPSPLTPYAPASAYTPANAFDPAVKPAGGVPTSLPPVVPAGGFVNRNAALQPAPADPYAVGAVACDPLGRLNCGAGCGPDERGWVRADYLLWAVKGSDTPPLVARDVSGTAQTAVGVPGTPGQQVLFSGAGLTATCGPASASAPGGGSATAARGA